MDNYDLRFRAVTAGDHRLMAAGSETQMQIHREPSQLHLLEQATYNELISLPDQDIEQLKHDLNENKKALQEQADEIERQLAVINIRERVKRNGRAA